MSYNYQPYQPMYGQGYGQPMQDQLAQLRQPYQPMQMQPVPQGQPMMPVQQTQPDNGMIWVQGEAGMKAFMVAPGHTVVLWDSEDPVFYIKSADMSGIPKVQTFDYSERDSAKRTLPIGSTNQYVTRAEFEDFAARINQMIQPMTGGTEVTNAE